MVSSVTKSLAVAAVLFGGLRAGMTADRSLIQTFGANLWALVGILSATKSSPAASQNGY
jgi:hypothetical protein